MEVRFSDGVTTMHTFLFSMFTKAIHRLIIVYSVFSISTSINGIFTAPVFFADVKECTLGIGKCFSTGTTLHPSVSRCVELEGSYECICADGYEHSSQDDKQTYGTILLTFDF